MGKNKILHKDLQIFSIFIINMKNPADQAGSFIPSAVKEDIVYAKECVQAYKYYITVFRS